MYTGRAPWCTAACPVHVDVRAFNKEIGKGNLATAFKILAKAGFFPESSAIFMTILVKAAVKEMKLTPRSPSMNWKYCEKCRC